MEKIDLVLSDVNSGDDLHGNSLFHASKELCASAAESVFNSTSGQVELTVQDEEYGYNTTYYMLSPICSFCWCSYWTGNPIPFWGQTFDSHNASLTCTQRRKGNFGNCDSAPSEEKVPERFSVICWGEQLHPCRGFSVNGCLKFPNCC